MFRREGSISVLWVMSDLLKHGGGLWMVPCFRETAYVSIPRATLLFPNPGAVYRGGSNHLGSSNATPIQWAEMESFTLAPSSNSGEILALSLVAWVGFGLSPDP